MAIIKPTVGRKVWYRPFGTDRARLGVFDNKQPCDATITYVWNDRMVNIRVVGPSGAVEQFNSVTLLQEGDLPPDNIENGGYAEWMVYQLKLAKLASQSPEAHPFPSAYTQKVELPVGTIVHVEGSVPLRHLGGGVFAGDGIPTILTLVSLDKEYQPPGHDIQPYSEDDVQRYVKNSFGRLPA